MSSRPRSPCTSPRRARRTARPSSSRPGGAFRFLMVDYEGVDMARWLVERGVTAFVSIPRHAHAGRRGRDEHLPSEPHARAQRRRYEVREPAAYDPATSAALAIAEEDGRQQSAMSAIMPPNGRSTRSRIGIAGFSAGGGVVMGPVMQHDATSRPDFAAPIYPAYRTATPVPATRRRFSSSSPTTTSSSPQTPAPGSIWPGTPPGNPPNSTSFAAAVTVSG